MSSTASLLALSKTSGSAASKAATSVSAIPTLASVPTWLAKLETSRRACSNV